MAALAGLPALAMPVIDVSAQEAGSEIEVIGTAESAETGVTSYVTLPEYNAQWVQTDGHWKFQNNSGQYLTSVWLQNGGKWYYFAADGNMQTGWVRVGGKWYYLASDGSMQTGWQKISGKWYYLSGSGAMKTGWQKIGGSWYYLKSDGSMAADEWVDDSKYFVDSSGKWTQNAQTQAPAAGTVEAYITASDTAKKTNQIILVNGHNISLWNKTNGTWQKQLEDYCGYGRNGLKLASNRREGDGTTPAGSFQILFAFGKSSNPGTEMTYRNVTSKSYWSGERSTYNTWVESSRRVSGEHLTDYYQYKYAMAIGFNTDPVVYGRGSAIFLHCKSNNTWNTSGCVSVYESTMVNLLKACRNGTYIIIVPTAADIANY